MSVVKNLLAIAGTILGGYLMGLAYTEKLGKSDINSIMLTFGFFMMGGSATYLIASFIKKLVK